MNSEFFNFLDEKVNGAKRKKVLEGMMNHSFGHVLARCIFSRLDPSDFYSARKQLLPENDGDEYGPYDHLLEPADCKRILRSFESDDYVMKLLTDDFCRKHERSPDSLSDIARIINHREDIRNGTAVPRATFQMLKADARLPPRVRIGSEWVWTRPVFSIKNIFR